MSRDTPRRVWIFRLARTGFPGQTDPSLQPIGALLTAYPRRPTEVRELPGNSDCLPRRDAAASGGNWPLNVLSREAVPRLICPASDWRLVGYGQRMAPREANRLVKHADRKMLHALLPHFAFAARLARSTLRAAVTESRSTSPEPPRAPDERLAQRLNTVSGLDANHRRALLESPPRSKEACRALCPKPSDFRFKWILLGSLVLVSLSAAISAVLAAVLTALSVLVLLTVLSVAVIYKGEEWRISALARHGKVTLGVIRRSRVYSEHLQSFSAEYEASPGKHRSVSVEGSGVLEHVREGSIVPVLMAPKDPDEAAVMVPGVGLVVSDVRI